MELLQVPLLKLQRDKDIGGRRQGKEQMAHGHCRSRPERDDKSEKGFFQPRGKFREVLEERHPRSFDGSVPFLNLLRVFLPRLVAQVTFGPTLISAMPSSFTAEV